MCKRDFKFLAISLVAFCGVSAFALVPSSVITLSEPETLFQTPDFNSDRMEIPANVDLVLGQENGNFTSASLIDGAGNELTGFVTASAVRRHPRCIPRNPHDCRHRQDRAETEQ